MKNILIIIILVIIGTGCKKDPLDITPDGRVTLNDVFNDEGQTGAYLNSCYNYIPGYGMSYYFYTLLAGYTDNGHDNSDPSDGATTDWYNGRLTPTYDPLSNWHSKSYAVWSGIYKTNMFLSRIDEANIKNPAFRARWKAEAKVLRAFYYWELIKKYGGMPIVDKPFPLTFDYSTLSRNTFDSCVQFIVKDCEEAIAEEQLPWRITTGEGDRGRMTKAIAYAIESEATLFNASPLWNPSNDPTKWKQAAIVSAKALDALKNNGYELFHDYESFFLMTPDLGLNPSDKETIFAKNSTDGFNATTDQMQTLNGALHSYKAGISPSQEMVDAYEMKNGEPAILGYSDEDHLQPIVNAQSGYDEKNPYENRDPRFYASVIYNGTYYPFADRVMQIYDGGLDGIKQNNGQYTKNGYYLRKFLDVRLHPAAVSAARWRRYRLGEIYLNLAEAENEVNGPSQVAYDAVNATRLRAGMPELPAGLTKDSLRTRIRNERRVELAFEENRFYDVRRWKILDKTDKSTSGMEWVKNTVTGTFTGTRIVVSRRKSWSDKFLIFPIPLTEIATLPAFKQNPGW